MRNPDLYVDASRLHVALQLRDAAGRSLTECDGCHLEIEIHLPSKPSRTAKCSVTSLPSTKSGVLDCELPVDKGSFSAANTNVPERDSNPNPNPNPNPGPNPGPDH